MQSIKKLFVENIKLTKLMMDRGHVKASDPFGSFINAGITVSVITLKIFLLDRSYPFVAATKFSA